MEGTGVEWRGGEGRGGEGRGGEDRAGQGRVPDCLGGLSRVGISSRSTRPWNGQPPSFKLIEGVSCYLSSTFLVHASCAQMNSFLVPGGTHVCHEFDQPQ